VEHGVTELVTGLDLVHEQLRLAAGEPLSQRVRDAGEGAAEPDRHAIEVRISAEDPGRGFAPTPGLLTRWVSPAGPGVRVDAGVEEGTRVGADYDPLLAKLLVVAPDRPTALSRLSRALGEFDVGGLQTTIPFHRWLAKHEAFARGGVTLDFVATEWQPSDDRERARQQALRMAARAAMQAPDGGAPSILSPGTDGRSPPEPSGDRWGSAGRQDGVARWPTR
ncbi:MAG: acetyl-/propionyl-CoA carboxylase subunit alpha, partial [Candidatus Limnocylindrales bacterium]